MISASRDVELGARSMLILAEGLFRFDVVPHPDTVQTLVRSLSPEVGTEFQSRDVGGSSNAFGEGGTIPGATARFGGTIVLIASDGGRREVAEVLAGSVCHLDRGLTSFTAQATLL